MIDKPIIDGERMFKCVWCKYDFKESDANFILSENPNECVCSSCMTEWADNLLWDFKRKEQECKALRDEKAYADMACEQFEKQINRYSQTLTEIKEVAKNMNKECFYDDFDCKDCDMQNGCTYFNKKQILQKISEVLDDK